MSGLDAPAPLATADCNLRGFGWMPLDVSTLIDSEFFIHTTGDEFKAAIALWCKSWMQVPAGSLPNNDLSLADLSRARNWKKVKDGALRGWVLCSDDRWYHPVIVAKALEALPSRKAHADNKAATNERKERERVDRKRLFALLREHGVVPDIHTKTTELRKLAEPFDSRTQSQDVTRDKAHDVTAKTEHDMTGEERTGPSSSAPTGAGGQPPAAAPGKKVEKPLTPAEQVKSKLWRDIKTMLVEQETADDVKAAGLLLGAAAKKYGEDVFLEAVRATVARSPVDAHTFLIGLCEAAAGKRVQQGRVGVLTDAQRQAANDESDAEAKRILFGGKPDLGVIDA